MIDKGIYVGRGYGKILLVGGYTVLIRPNKALVLPVKNAYIKVRANKGIKWVINSSYGLWSGDDINDAQEPFHFVREAIRVVGIKEPHTIEIKETEHFRPGKKVGLGSSAAVTVATVKAFLKEKHEEVFKRAYVAHTRAQGKIGSGFDVAAATFGEPIVYERPKKKDGTGFKVERVHIPENLYFRLFNVKGKGTNTSISARKVMVARNENPYVREIFEELANYNEEAIQAFRRKNVDAFLQLIGKINMLRRELGKLSGVPIEPPELDIIREFFERRGYRTLLPGAGGYDSILVMGTKPIPVLRHPDLEEVRIRLR